jgi:hypothetical protein
VGLGRHACLLVIAEDDDLAMYILVVARTQNLLWPVSKMRWYILNPSCDEDYAVVGRHPLLLWC